MKLTDTGRAVIRSGFAHVETPLRTVTYEGITIATFAYRFWQCGAHSDPNLMRAVREAIFSMQNDTSAEEMRREIADRYLAIIDEKG